MSARQILDSARVDLLDRIADGIPDRPHVPGSDILLAGKRYLILAPAKSGKSIVTLTHVVDIVHAGGRVAILDRENGADEYARRLQDITNHRMSGINVEALRRDLVYFEFPALKLEHGGEPLAAALRKFDVVVFDSSRGFLTASGLGENDSDDYGRFMAAMVDPLAHAGVATVLLDNTGHGDRGRGRGTSSKADLNEVVIVLEPRGDFDRRTMSVVNLTVTHTRFPEVARRWQIPLGGGTYGPLELRDDEGRVDDELAGRIITLVASEGPITRNQIVGKVGAQKQRVLTDVARLIETGALRLDDAGRVVPSSEPVPVVRNRFGTTPESVVPAVPALKGGEPVGNQPTGTLGAGTGEGV